jgi:hypothetical protein
MLWLAPNSWSFIADTPVTPDASPEAQALLAYLASVYGHHIISGQQENWRPASNSSFELKYLKANTGKLPALISLDLTGYSSKSWRRDTNHLVVAHARDWFVNQHGLVAFCWHWRAPLDKPAFYTKETDFDLTRAVTPGTPEYDAILHDLDLIAAELTVLRDAHIPVLWRPLHEANGRWFWWGRHGPEPFKQLWRLMYEQLALKHHLNNLIWVYSVGGETDLAAWYPGDAYVDIVGQDLYPMDGNHGVARDIFDELKTLTGGRKLVALSENGPVPDPSALVSEQAGWLYFATWSGDILTKANTPAQLHDLYHSPYVLNQGDLPDVAHFPFPATGQPAKLAFASPPIAVAVNGLRYLPVNVLVQDKHGHTVRTGIYAVSLQLKSKNNGQLSGALTVPTVNGVATFSDLKINAAARKDKFVATALALKSAVSPAFAVGPGNGLTYQWWTNFSDFAQPPSGQTQLTDALISPVAHATQFAARLQGSLLAPETGAYHFWLASAGNSEIWLTANATTNQPVKIVEVTGATPYSKWPDTKEASSIPVPLVAGRAYHFELRQQQPHGSTQFALRWQMPDGRQERPIPACRFLAQP